MPDPAADEDDWWEALQEEGAELVHTLDLSNRPLVGSGLHRVPLAVREEAQVAALQPRAAIERKSVIRTIHTERDVQATGGSAGADYQQEQQTATCEARLHSRLN